MTERRRDDDGGDARDDSDGDDSGGGGEQGRGPDDATSEFIERFAAQLVLSGMTRMPARVFVALLSSEKGVMSSAELGEQLKVSPAAVSGAVRYLSQVDMVTREREPGSRRERYRVQDNQWYEALASRDGVLRRWQAVLQEGVDHFGLDTPQGRRINDTREFFQFVEKELGALMDRWAEHKAAQLGTR